MPAVDDDELGEVFTAFTAFLPSLKRQASRFSMDSFPANTPDSPVQEPPDLSTRRTSAPPPAQTLQRDQHSPPQPQTLLVHRRVLATPGSEPTCLSICETSALPQTTPHSPAGLTDLPTQGPASSQDPLCQGDHLLDSSTLSEANANSPSDESLFSSPGSTTSQDSSAIHIVRNNGDESSLPSTTADETNVAQEEDDENPGTSSPADGDGENLASSSADAPPREVDDTCDESDSTTSLTGSILQYRRINGRRFHAELGQARYWAPNDERQLDSEAIQDHAMRLVMKRKGWVHHHNDADVHFAAPVDIDRCQKVLDIGTGLGFWAIDFADTYPQVHVVGTDLSPVQPEWVPPNAEFQVDDFGDYPWTFEPDSFDFVHGRGNTGSVTSWDAHFEQAYRVLRPGGFLESHEPWPDIEQYEGAREATYLKKWGELFRAAGERAGKAFDVAVTGMQKRSMEKAGFMDVREEIILVPIGWWPKDEDLKEIGIAQLEAFSSDIEGYMGYIATEIMGWSKPRADILAAHIRREVKNPKHLPFFRHTVIWGRKP